MPKTLFKLLDNDCRYITSPVNHDRGAMFCAEPKQFGSSFCPHHHAICYQPRSGTRARSPIGIPVDKVEDAKKIERILDVVEGWK